MEAVKIDKNTMKKANQLLAGNPKKPKPDPYTKTNKIINIKLACKLNNFSIILISTRYRNESQNKYE